MSRQGEVDIKLNCNAMLQAIETNPSSSTHRLSGELNISQFRVFCYHQQKYS